MAPSSELTLSGPRSETWFDLSLSCDGGLIRDGLRPGNVGSLGCQTGTDGLEEMISVTCVKSWRAIRRRDCQESVPLLAAGCRERTGRPRAGRVAPRSLILVPPYTDSAPTLTVWPVSRSENRRRTPISGLVSEGRLIVRSCG